MRPKLALALSVVWMIGCLASTSLETSLQGPYPALVDECHTGIDREGNLFLRVTLSFTYVGPRGEVSARVTTVVPYGTREYLLLRQCAQVSVWIDASGYIRRIEEIK